MAKILNYTTTVSAEKTAQQIQRLLAESGAQATMIEYDQAGEPAAISFRIDYLGQVMSFRPPVDVDAVYRVLAKGRRVRQSSEKNLREQAARTAWRIIKDLIEAQLAVRASGQADLIQLYLQYWQNDNGQTLYQKLKDRGFKLLEAPQ